MNYGEVSSAGLFGNALSDLKLAFVIVSDALIIANWQNDFVAVFDALFQDFLDAKFFILANPIMNQSDISATGLFGNTLSDLKLAFVIVGDTLVITDWFHDLGALFQALFKGFL